MFSLSFSTFTLLHPSTPKKINVGVYSFCIYIYIYILIIALLVHPMQWSLFTGHCFAFASWWLAVPPGVCLTAWELAFWRERSRAVSLQVHCDLKLYYSCFKEFMGNAPRFNYSMGDGHRTSTVKKWEGEPHTNNNSEDLGFLTLRFSWAFTHSGTPLTPITAHRHTSIHIVCLFFLSPSTFSLLHSHTTKKKTWVCIPIAYIYSHSRSPRTPYCTHPPRKKKELRLTESWCASIMLIEK